MAKTVSEVMTHDPRTVETTANLVDVAQAMRDGDVGAILVVEEGRARGIVTDRDLVVRSLASGRDPHSTPVGSLCSKNLISISPDQSIDDAIQLVREHAIRRIPVVQDGRPVGILSIGDLAIERDSNSALADLSSASPNN